MARGVRDVNWSKAIESFTCKKQQLEGQAFIYGQPVKVSENRIRVVVALGTGDKSRSSVLDTLQFIKITCRQTIQQAVAVVQPGGYECVHESFDVRLGNIFAHTADVPDDERSISTDIVDVASQVEVTIKHNSQITDLVSQFNRGI